MSVRKALILAAGKGTRMAELTRHAPKPMLPLRGKPILEHVLDRLGQAGISSALIVVGYYGDQIRRHLEHYPMHLEFREQTVLNGTAPAALLGREFIAGEPFLLTFGDILSMPADYRALLDLLSEPVQGVLGVKYADDPARGAAVYEENGRVVRMIEKPPPGASTTNWNSAGVYAFEPVLFSELERVPLSPRGEYEITSAISQLIDAGHLLKLYAIEGEWIDVGRPEDLSKAEQFLQHSLFNRGKR
ncbi:MAG: nucleotidyltransferase family protein [Acidobacteria bacterium]|nr:nucleotidyltransferase family protein [Acidobacteriota bacterium]